MLDKKDLKEILDLALAKGGDFADIYLEEKQTTSVMCEAKQIERINAGIEVGAGLRVISGENTSYAYTNDLSLDSLQKLASTVAQAASGSKSATMDLTKLQPKLELQVTNLPDQVSVEDKVDLVQRANKTAWEIDERIKQVSIGYGDVVQNVTIANSLGDLAEDKRVRTRFMVNGVAAEGEVIQTGFDAVGGFSGFEFYDQVSPEEVADNAVKRAITMLEAKPAPAGKMPVVMAGEAGGTMVHEACGHGLEADLVQKGVSVYANKIGELVASPLVTVVDDGTIPGKYGSFRFDDEAVCSNKTVLIENGVLKDYMYDRITATKEKRKPTGNGRRESYQHKPIPRMTNTYIASGETKPAEIVKDTKKGLLVKKMGGGQVNTANGDFVFDVAEGYLIENGEITTAVRGATLTGNGPQSLKDVDLVGTDFGYAIGTCGKDGQGAPVADAQPTMRITQMVVGGTAHEEEGPQLKRQALEENKYQSKHQRKEGKIRRL
ncbi:MAG: TldD/PmbA family protein [Bacillota bacterium]|nr:TldD/PmbA family protein [Bacillota bacterium]